jgi:hypothetical protein
MPGLLWEMQQAQLEADRPQGWRTSTGIYFPCVDDNVDVHTTISGSTHTLFIARRAVAELSPADERTLVIRRGVGAYAGQVTVGLRGSARWLVTDLNFIQVQTPGMVGSVTIRYGTRPDEMLFMRFGAHVDLPRTAVIHSTARTDHVRMCNARTVAELTTALPPATRAIEGDLDRLSSLHYDLPGFAVPTRAEAATIRQAFVDITQAITSGNFVQAAALSRGLGLPAPENGAGHVDFSSLSSQEWKTFVALGGVSVTSGGQSHTNTGNRELNAIQGTGHYITLIDDMAECGVDPLDAPPSFDQIHRYYENARLETSDVSSTAVTTRLLGACQRVMKGMLVHYRAAGNVDPEWGANRLPSMFLYVDHRLVLAEGSRPMAFASQRDVRAYTSAHGGGPHARHQDMSFTARTQSPEGYAVLLSRGVYGRRYESDCEGMASFRLRTLPPGFNPVGIVSGQLRSGGIGHVVAVFSSPDHKLYLSSNDKPPLPVIPGTGARYDTDTVRNAVAAEFTAIYHGATDFEYGVAGAPAPAAGAPADRNPIIDRMHHDADVNQLLLHFERTHRGFSGATLDWDQLVPWWI